MNSSNGGDKNHMDSSTCGEASAKYVGLSHSYNSCEVKPTSSSKQISRQWDKDQSISSRCGSPRPSKRKRNTSADRFGSHRCLESYHDDRYSSPFDHHYDSFDSNQRGSHSGRRRSRSRSSSLHRSTTYRKDTRSGAGNGSYRNYRDDRRDNRHNHGNGSRKREGRFYSARESSPARWTKDQYAHDFSSREASSPFKQKLNSSHDSSVQVSTHRDQVVLIEDDIAGESKPEARATSESIDDEAFEETPSIDEAALFEGRRHRREAIKAKYKSLQATCANDTPNISDVISADGNGVPVSVAPSADTKENLDEGKLLVNNDKREDRVVEINIVNEDNSNEGNNTRKGNATSEHVAEAQNDNSKECKKKGDFDMFASDDDFDMFATEDNVQPILRDNLDVKDAISKRLDVGLLENWDDSDGYYRVILGELLEGRYHVQTNLGKGMFSSVVRALDRKTNKLVAIKLIRNNATMRKAGLKEIEFLNKLKAADPDDRKHIIRLERHFEHKGHMCMVFENLSINLREVLIKFGRDVGLNLKAVRSYAQQMFLGLSLLRRCGVLHADLKPDNVLVNENWSLLKICDLGSAGDISDGETTPYLVSRFYRAPEIMLGLPPDFAIDVWAAGCTLFELFTGRILFTGRTNNQMLRAIMECRGKFPVKLLKRAQFTHVHFDGELRFRSREQDRISGREVVRLIPVVRVTRDLKSQLLPSWGSGGVKGERAAEEAEAREISLFADLLDKCLHLNPEKRCTPAEALRHPFITRTSLASKANSASRKSEVSGNANAPASAATTASTATTTGVTLPRRFTNEQVGQQSSSSRIQVSTTL